MTALADYILECAVLHGSGSDTPCLCGECYEKLVDTMMNLVDGEAVDEEV